MSIIETTNIETLTSVQLLRAYKLARAYGHTWATFAPKPATELVADEFDRDRYLADEENYAQGFIELMQCTTPAEIEALCFRRLQPGACGWGITAPNMDRGNVVHTTGTGRLSWEVYPCGSVALTVNRSDSSFLQIGFDPDIDDCFTVVLGERIGYGFKERSLSVQAFAPAPHADGGEYVPVEVTWTSAGGDKETFQTSLDFLGRRCADHDMRRFHLRHVYALINAYRALTDAENPEVELALLALQGAARPDGVIVSRHPAAVEYILMHVPGARNFPIIDHATEEDVVGQHVFGNVPLHLAALADKVTVIEFQGDAPRGAEYSLDQMIQAGAELRTYQVTWSY